VLTVVGSVQPAAGATTCALLLGYRRHATVVEANPSGGDVAAWLGRPDTGLSDLAAALLRQGQVGAAQLQACASLTSYGVPVVTAPLLTDGAAACAVAVADVLAKLATDTDLVVDVGRVSSYPAVRLLPHAAVVVLLAAPTAAGLTRLRSRLPGLAQTCGDRLRLLVSQAMPGGPPRYPAAEVARVLGHPVTVWPFDPRGAAILAGWPGRLPAPGQRLGRWRRWRHPMWEAASRL
jgi:hypothetical protein